MRDVKRLPLSPAPPARGGPQPLPVGELSVGEGTVSFRPLPNIAARDGSGEYTGTGAPGFGVLRAAGQA